MPDNVINFSDNAVACRQCSLHGMCLPPSIDRSTQEILDSAIRKRRPVARGDVLYRSGEPLDAIYCVRSGSIKTYSTSNDGSEMVTGFHLPGELLGLTGFSTNQSHCTAVALETSSICEIPFDRLGELTQKIPSLQKELMRLLSGKILHYQNLMLLVGRKSAEERVAALLFSLSKRFKSRGFSAAEFYLSMSRNDIANYLGLAVETVSRVFTRFDEDGLLTVRRKYIHILDMERLHQLAGNPISEQQLSAFS